MDNELSRTMEAILGVAGCAFCRRLLPRIEADDSDPVVQAWGRLCDSCYEQQEGTR